MVTLYLIHSFGDVLIDFSIFSGAPHPAAPDQRPGRAAVGARVRERGRERQADADGHRAGFAAHAHHRRPTPQV